MNPKLVTTTPRVAVFGGINVDDFLRVRSLPRPGETVLGTGWLRTLGGKAANQSIAVARTGVAVSLLAAVGEDAEGGQMIAALQRSGVEVTGLLRVGHAPTGRATILVDDDGQNVIVVTPASNGHLSESHVEGFRAAIEQADVLVVQGEVSASATTAAVLLAENLGVRVVINLAPFIDLGRATRVADPLVVNEIEASQFLGREIDLASAADAADLINFARSAVVTLGADGALVIEHGKPIRHVPAPPAAEVVDTTGAGDAFVGVLAAAIAGGLPLDVAVKRAVESATASVGVLGAGERYPEFELGIKTAELEDEVAG